MKKSLIALVVATTAFAANAQVTGIVKYDYDRGSRSTDNISVHQSKIGVQYSIGAFGVVDASAVVRQDAASVRSTNPGFDLGYSNGVTLGLVNVAGRLGYTRVRGNVNQFAYDPNYGLALGVFADGKLSRYSASVEVNLPITQRVSTFVGIEHQKDKWTGDALVAALFAPSVKAFFIDAEGATVRERTNRITVGVDFATTDKLSLRAGFVRGVGEGDARSNGLTTAISYKF